MLKFQKNDQQFLRPQENVTPDAGRWTTDAGQNPDAIKIPLALLRRGIKTTVVDR